MSQVTFELSDDDVERIAARVAERLRSPKPEWLSLGEAAKLVKRSERTLARMIATGRLRAQKDGSAKQAHVRIRRVDLLAAFGMNED